MLKDLGPFLKILLRFVIIYVVLVFLYQQYLDGNGSTSLDPFSRWITKQVVYVQEFFGYASSLYPEANQPRTYYLIQNRIVTVMVEGCNALSVMIMFVAFVFAFYKGFKTFGFVLVGLVLLHIMNVLRIAGLNIVMFERPEDNQMFHDYIFPAVIYGTVVILWIVWIQFFDTKKKTYAQTS